MSLVSLTRGKVDKLAMSYWQRRVLLDYPGTPPEVAQEIAQEKVNEERRQHVERQEVALRSVRGEVDG